MFAGGLSYMAFTMLRQVPSMPIFWKSFNHKWVLNFVKGFFCIYWDYHMVFISNLLIWCITLIDLHILKNPCIPGINPTWSWCMGFMICCWILFAKILLRIFASMFISDIVENCSFLFLCCLCLILVSRGWWPHRMSLEVFLPLQFFGKSFRRLGIS